MTRFETEWRFVQTALFGLAMRLTLHRERAEDLFCMTRLRAFRAFSQWDGTRSFKNWAMRIMTNTHRDDLRNAARRPNEVVSIEACEEDGLTFWAMAPEIDPLEEMQLAETLEAAIEPLSYEHRQLAKLLAVDSSYRQMAERLDIPIGTVRSRVCRMRAVLN